MFKLLWSPSESGEEVVVDAEPAAVEPTVEPEKDPAKAFAARLGHERKKLEAEYTPFKSVIEKQARQSGMSTEEYLTFVRERQEQEELEEEAEKSGKTPEVLKVEMEKKAIEDRLAQYEKKERITAEEKTLMSDPKIGKFVTENLERIREIAETTNTNLQTGLAIVAADLLPDLLEKADPEKQKDTIIRDYLENVRRGGRPVEIGGGASTPQEHKPKTFDDARKAAIEMLRGQRQ